MINEGHYCYYSLKITEMHLLPSPPDAHIYTQTTHIYSYSYIKYTNTRTAEGVGWHVRKACEVVLMCSRYFVHKNSLEWYKRILSRSGISFVLLPPPPRPVKSSWVCCSQSQLTLGARHCTSRAACQSITRPYCTYYVHFDSLELSSPF